MGTTEEAGKAVNSFLDIMKSQPLSLALVVMNILLLMLLWSVYNSADKARQDEMSMIFKAQSDMQILLSRCVVPPSEKT